MKPGKLIGTFATYVFEFLTGGKLTVVVTKPKNTLRASFTYEKPSAEAKSKPAPAPAPAEPAATTGDTPAAPAMPAPDDVVEAADTDATGDEDEELEAEATGATDEDAQPGDIPPGEGEDDVMATAP